MNGFVKSMRNLLRIPDKDALAGAKAEEAHEMYSDNLREFEGKRSDAVRLHDACQMQLQAAIARGAPSAEQRALTKQIGDHKQKIKEYDGRLKKVRALRDQLDTSRVNSEQVQAMKMANEADRLMMESRGLDEASINDVIDECEEVRSRTLAITEQLTADFLESDNEASESDDEDWEYKARMAAGLPEEQHAQAPRMPNAPTTAAQAEEDSPVGLRF
jgi:hypothetical protein